HHISRFIFVIIVLHTHITKQRARLEDGNGSVRQLEILPLILYFFGRKGDKNTIVSGNVSGTKTLSTAKNTYVSETPTTTDSTTT
ncbi:hypothetical protein P7M41_26935, partial [Vibrio parahaemolyticus]|nr:hypothetical protein [Vibrio parahaemolyticus]